MSFIDSLKGVYAATLTARWPREERLSLLRILHEVYQSDGKFSDTEREAYRLFCTSLHIPVDEVMARTLQEALALLRGDPEREHLLDRWIAAAVFVDDRFTGGERELIERLCRDLSLDKHGLWREVRRQQQLRLDEALGELAVEIDGATLVSRSTSTTERIS